MKVESANQQVFGMEAVDTGKAEQTEKENSRGQKQKDSAIYAGELNLPGDKIREARERAKKMARNLIADAFEGDREIDSYVSDSSKRVSELEKDNMEQMQLLKDIDNERGMLREHYDIEEGSSEDEELALLRKQSSDPDALTEEEKERAAAIYKRGLTDYQSESLRLDSAEKEIKGRIKNNNNEIIEQNAVVRGIQIERLKRHDMVDARKQGKELIDAANKEVIGIILDSSRQKIDEDMQERKETLEKKKEEEERLQEKIDSEKASEERKEKELEKMYELGSAMENVKTESMNSGVQDLKKSLTQVVNEMKLAADDIKGLVVDADS